MSSGERLYRLLLYLYPRPHRDDYGDLMLLHVRDQLRDARAQGRGHVARLWSLILLDTASNAPAEHLALAKESLMTVQPHGHRPLPWWQILFAVLPGLAMLATLAAGADGVLLAALLAVVLVAGAVWWRTRTFPVWALLLVGFGAGLAAIVTAFGLGGWVNRLWPELFARRPSGYAFQLEALAISVFLTAVAAAVLLAHARRHGILRRAGLLLVALLAVPLLELLVGIARGRYAAQFAIKGVLLGQVGPMLMLLALIALGLPLARRYGLLAALFVVGPLSFIYGGFFDPAEGIFILPVHPLLAWSARLAAPALITVVAPLCFLRAGSRRGRRLGLLIPVAAAFAIAVIVFGLARAHVPIAGFAASERLSLRLLQASLGPAGLLLALGLALALYDLPPAPTVEGDYAATP